MTGIMTRIKIFLCIAILISFIRCTAKSSHSEVPGFMEPDLFEQEDATDAEKAANLFCCAVRHEYHYNAYDISEDHSIAEYDSVSGYYIAWVRKRRDSDSYSGYVKLRNHGGYVFKDNPREGIINFFLYWPYYGL